WRTWSMSRTTLSRHTILRPNTNLASQHAHLLTITPENVAYQTGELAKGLGLFLYIFVPVIHVNDSGLHMTEKVLGTLAPYADTAHKRASRAAKVMHLPMRERSCSLVESVLASRVSPKV